MSPAAFLRDRALSVAVAIVCAIAIGSVVAVLGAGPDASVLAACIVLACAAFALTVDYARRRAFYRDLEQVVGDLDRTYYATALIEPPDFLEGRLAYEALQATGKAAADDVAAHKQQAEAYRDYIELWIHEIKTPIAAAALMASGLHGPQAARIKGELDRIEGYVEQALYYARSTSLVQDYAIRETSLAEAVREALRKHARFLIERGVAPTVDVDEDVRVFADVKWLAFVIGQLVANAGKYGASTLRFSVREEGAGTSDARTVLEVADDGWGVPAGDVPRVFDAPSPARTAGVRARPRAWGCTSWPSCARRWASPWRWPRKRGRARACCWRSRTIAASSTCCREGHALPLSFVRR